MSVDRRSRSECAASASRPRLPEREPTRSFSKARAPLAITEAVAIDSLEPALRSLPTLYRILEKQNNPIINPRIGKETWEAWKDGRLKGGFNDGGRQQTRPRHPPSTLLFLNPDSLW